MKFILDKYNVNKKIERVTPNQYSSTYQNQRAKERQVVMPKRSAKDRKRKRRMINDELKKTGRTKAQRKRYAKQQQKKKDTLLNV